MVSSPNQLGGKRPSERIRRVDLLPDRSELVEARAHRSRLHGQRGDRGGDRLDHNGASFVDSGGS